MHTILDERDKLEITNRIGSISNNLFRVTKTGKSIVAEDSQRYIPKGLRVFGSSEQKTTGGHQLIPYPFTDTTKTIAGVTFTDEGDGWISVSGTSTAKSAFILVMDGALNVNSGDDVTIYSEIVGSVDKLFITGWTSTWGKFLEEKSLSLKAGANTTGKIASNIVKLQVSVEDVDINFNGKIRVMLNKGTTALPWEPYTGGIPAPNPEYPQEIVDTMLEEVSVYGGNLLDNSKTIYAYSDGIVSDLAEMMSSIIDVRGIDTVYISGDWKLLDAGIARIGLYNEYPVIGSSGTRINASGNTVLDVNSANYLLIGLLKASGISKEDIKKSFVLNVGSKALPYEPYNKQSLAITTPNGLPGIKVTDASLATYTDENGQMYCADEIDFERGVYVKRIERISITSDRHARSDLYDSYNLFSFDTYVLYDIDNYVSRIIPAMSNKFINTNNTINSFNASTIADSGWKGCMRIIFKMDKSIASLNDFMNYVGDDCFVQVPLKTPIEIPLSAEELAQYKALMMNYPTTTILNNANAHMEVEYVANTQNHIEQNYLSKSEFETLKTRISSIEKSIL